MVSEVGGFESIIITFLITGYGYFILFMSFRESKLLKTFYQLNSFDKGIQSLISGFILWVFSSTTLRIPLTFEGVTSNLFVIFLVQLFYSYLIIQILSRNIGLLVPKSSYLEI